MTVEMIDVLADYNATLEVGCVPLTLKALKKLVEVFNDTKKVVNEVINNSRCIDSAEETIDAIYDKVRHLAYFDDFNRIDKDLLDVVYLNHNVNTGEVDEVTLTVTAYDRVNPELSRYIEFGIKGEDYPIGYDMDDIEYTIKKYDKEN